MNPLPLHPMRVLQRVASLASQVVKVFLHLQLVMSQMISRYITRLSLSRLRASLTSATAAWRISYRSSKAFLTQEAKVGFEILCLPVSVWSSDVLQSWKKRLNSCSHFAFATLQPARHPSWRAERTKSEAEFWMTSPAKLELCHIFPPLWTIEKTFDSWRMSIEDLYKAWRQKIKKKYREASVLPSFAWNALKWPPFPPSQQYAYCTRQWHYIMKEYERIWKWSIWHCHPCWDAIVSQGFEKNANKVSGRHSQKRGGPVYKFESMFGTYRTTIWTNKFSSVRTSTHLYSLSLHQREESGWH